ncbi:hypothetical protein [Armatimonas sp.]|uniref:hypothetical protein n=1 Tax=Armatimonas sp. TaxID=1872638 RepID=UPI00374D7D1E
MRDTYDVILAVVAALGIGVFCGMPLHAPSMPPSGNTTAAATPSTLGERQATRGLEPTRGLVVVAQGRATAKHKSQ